MKKPRSDNRKDEPNSGQPRGLSESPVSPLNPNQPVRPPRLPAGPERRGIVKSFNKSKGVGVIAPQDGGSDVIVRAAALSRAGLTELIEGQHVAFRLIMGKKHPEAQSIRPTEPWPNPAKPPPKP